MQVWIVMFSDGEWDSWYTLVDSLWSTKESAEEYVTSKKDDRYSLDQDAYFLDRQGDS